MSERTIKQAEIMEQLKRKEISKREAAALLSLSTRQIRRKFKKYLERGMTSLVHGNKGKVSNRRTPSGIEKKILELVRTKYEGFGPTFAAEKLAELNGITIHPETLRLLLMREGLWHRQRRRYKYKRWRKPKEFFGEMAQLDGSLHVWAGNQQWTLLKFIDDATKTNLWMEFVLSESWKSVAQATINYFYKHGIPRALYTDRGKVFKVNVHNKEDVFITQYQRALDMLNVKLIHAHSPQAKGRIERSFHTDQDRLVKELKLAGINTIDQANKFLQEYYIPKMNSIFTIPPAKEGNLHQKVSSTYRLEDIFCIQATRIVQHDWVVRYNNRFLQIDHTRPAIVKPKDHVIVHERIDGTIFLSIRSQIIPFTEITERNHYVKPQQKIYSPTVHKPKTDHPWRVYPVCR